MPNPTRQIFCLSYHTPIKHCPYAIPLPCPTYCTTITPPNQPHPSTLPCPQTRASIPSNNHCHNLATSSTHTALPTIHLSMTLRNPPPPYLWFSCFPATLWWIRVLCVRAPSVAAMTSNSTNLASVMSWTERALRTTILESWNRKEGAGTNTITVTGWSWWWDILYYKQEVNDTCAN